MRTTEPAETARAVIVALFSIALAALPAEAQNFTPSSHPLLKKYKDWVQRHVKEEYTRYWRIYDGGAGREPYVIYCRDAIFSDSALNGKRVRVRSGSAAQKFFPRITGTTAQLLSASEINVALKLGVIDCLGFGGEETGQAATPPGGAFTRETIEVVSHSLGLTISHKPLLYKSMDVLDWKFYRATNGDLGTINQLFGGYLDHARYENSVPYFHLTGFWAVRIYQYTAPEGKLQYGHLVEAARGNCKGREELCKGIQIELKRIGKYSGAIDGVIGRGTRAAISAIAGTRMQGDPSKLKTLKEFVADGKSPPDTLPSTKSDPPKPAPAGPRPPKVSDSLDDF